MLYTYKILKAVSFRTTAMAAKCKTPARANGDLRPGAFGLDGKLKQRDLAFLAAVLGPHAFVIVATIVSANWTVVEGGNAYLAYGSACWGIVSYMILAFRAGSR
jgi:hypothetical protein